MLRHSRNRSRGARKNQARESRRRTFSVRHIDIVKLLPQSTAPRLADIGPRLAGGLLRQPAVRVRCEATGYRSAEITKGWLTIRPRPS